MNMRSIYIPRTAGNFVNIYKPEAALYSLPDAITPDGNITYKQGEIYPQWRTNDHTFIRDGNGRWHCFGITKPWQDGDNSHCGEGLCFHALAPSGDFESVITHQSWIDLPKISVGDCGWAPAAAKIEHDHVLIGSHLGIAKSRDLLLWTDSGHLQVKGGVRDPFLFIHENRYHLLRCAGTGINCVCSEDFADWSDPVVIYRPEQPTYQTESPVMVRFEGMFYLFWTLWDTDDLTTYGYCPRTFVHCSDDPMNFSGKPILAEFTAHAPEIFQSENGNWFMSSVDYPHRGISVAPLIWCKVR